LKCEGYFIHKTFILHAFYKKQRERYHSSITRPSLHSSGVGGLDTRSILVPCFRAWLCVLRSKIVIVRRND
jgi:hypothetical protein